MEEKRIIQKLDEFSLPEKDVSFIPKTIRNFFIENIIKRAFVYLFGYDGHKFVRLKCTSAGALKTAPLGTGFEHNDTKKGTASDDYGSDILFDSIVSRVDVFIWDNDAIIKRINADGNYEDEIEIPAGTMYSFDCSTKGFNIKNKTAGQNARYQVVGWY